MLAIAIRPPSSFSLSCRDGSEPHWMRERELESVLAQKCRSFGVQCTRHWKRRSLRQFVRGIYLARHNRQGHASYLFGEFRMKGWWYFFPVVVGVKTPIGFLLLAACGVAAILRDFRSGPWQQHLTLIFAIVILLVCMGSGIDLGVRRI